MQDLGKRYEFHTHTIFSDGILLPNALVREAEMRNSAALAITDHVDASNIEFCIKSIVNFIKTIQKHVSMKLIPGAEVSYMPVNLIPEYCRKARKLGAKLIIIHGESPVEPVPAGTNHAAVSQKGIVDILAHPGNISEEDVKLAKQNGVFLELSARAGHGQGNKHVAALAKKFGADLLVNSDSHSDKDLITQTDAYKIACEAGLSEEEALIVIQKNPKKLLDRLT